MEDHHEASSYYAQEDSHQRARQSTEQRDSREPHLLNLKVLRASRPSFARSEDAIDDIPARKSASRSGFKLTPLLALPNTFGNINLGETFFGVVVAANDSAREVFDATLKIEIQTQNSRVTLWETPAAHSDKPRSLKPGETLEAPLLEYEIREPGLHALTCSVSYWLPAPSSYIDPNGPSERFGRSFRKLYKFQASNPLSVKTKIHTSRNVAAAMDEEAEHTVYLEVQVQNVSPAPLLFEHLLFHPSEGLDLRDHNADRGAYVQPLDTIQQLYVLAPHAGQTQQVVEKARQAGGAMALGKLDIRWRGKMGDGGHLATSQLVRRIPVPALPPALSPRASMSHFGTGNKHPDRAPSALGTLRARSPSPSPSNSPRLATGTFSPVASPRHSAQFEELPIFSQRTGDLHGALYLSEMNTALFAVGKPFKLPFQLKLASTCRLPGASENRQRKLRLAVQHVDHHTVSHEVGEALAQSVQAVGTPNASARQSLETSRPLPPTPTVSRSRRGSHSTNAGEISERPPLPPPRPLARGDPFHLPRPPPALFPSPDVKFVGSSLIELTEITIDHSAGPRPTYAVAPAEVGESDANPSIRVSLDSNATDDAPLSEVIKRSAAGRQQYATVRFDLEYVAFRQGIQRVGGVRVLLIAEEWQEHGETVRHGSHSWIVAEHDIVAELVIGT